MKKMHSLLNKKNIQPFFEKISAAAGILFLFVLLPVLSGCHSTQPQLYNVHWRPVGQAPEKVFLIFTSDKRRIIGCSGGNRFFGPVKIEKNTISVGMLGATRMATPYAQYEQKFLHDLQSAKTYRFESDGTLTLIDIDGEPCMRLKAVPQPIEQRDEK
jgi:heat shock protein HslJ